MFVSIKFYFIIFLFVQAGGEVCVSVCVAVGPDNDSGMLVLLNSCCALARTAILSLSLTHSHQAHARRAGSK